MDLLRKTKMLEASLLVLLWPNAQISLLLKEIIFMMLPYTRAPLELCSIFLLLTLT